MPSTRVCHRAAGILDRVGVPRRREGAAHLGARSGRDWASAINQPDRIVLVAEDGSVDILGVAECEHAPGQGRLPWLQMLYVVPSAWGIGAAVGLLQGALDAAHRAGHRTVWLEVVNAPPLDQPVEETVPEGSSPLRGGDTGSGILPLREARRMNERRSDPGRRFAIRGQCRGVRRQATDQIKGPPHPPAAGRESTPPSCGWPSGCCGTPRRSG
jgi:GNAT superfamily N-acetyltransferase